MCAAAADGAGAQHAAALGLLGAAVALQADAAGELAHAAAVQALAEFVGRPGQAVEQQAEAASILAAVAAVPVKRAGVQQALTDCALPRAFEVVHEAAAAAHEAPPAAGSALEAAPRRRLQAAAADIVAQLVGQDRECCHSLLFHAQLLRPAVLMLIAGGRFAAAQQLLEATRSYASSLVPPAAPHASNGCSSIAPGGHDASLAAGQAV